jgi:hypothetical protein
MAEKAAAVPEALFEVYTEQPTGHRRVHRLAAKDAATARKVAVEDLGVPEDEIYGVVPDGAPAPER